MGPKIKFSDGINDMLKDIKKWRDAPLWTPKKIKNATKTWFSFKKMKLKDNPKYYKKIVNLKTLKKILGKRQEREGHLQKFR